MGCGDGYFTRVCRQLTGNDVAGVDVSQEFINNATKMGPDSIQYAVADCKTYRSHEKFDIVTSCFMLQHAATSDDLLAFM
jgi:2-polyprenyl-3-methyl-5-hydroxy-6-metoxy-1,4-benzoquinol methylase